MNRESCGGCKNLNLWQFSRFSVDSQILKRYELRLRKPDLSKMASSLRSMFTSGETDILSRIPDPPSASEMIEDLELCQMDDPIMSFAQFLLQKGSGDQIDVPSSTMIDKHELDTKYDWLDESLAMAAIRDAFKTPATTTSTVQHLLAKSPAAIGSTALLCTVKDSPTSVGSSTNSYNPKESPSHIHSKFKELSLVCTKTDNLLRSVEGRLKEIHTGCQEILNSPFRKSPKSF